MSASIKTGVATGIALICLTFNGCEKQADSELVASADRIDQLVQQLYSFKYIEMFPAPADGLALYLDALQDEHTPDRERLQAIGLSSRNLLIEIKTVADSIVVETKSARAAIHGKEMNCISGGDIDQAAVARHILGNAKLLFNLVYEARFPFRRDDTVHDLESCDPKNPEDVDKVGNILNDIECRARSISEIVSNYIYSNTAVDL